MLIVRSYQNTSQRMKYFVLSCHHLQDRDFAPSEVCLHRIGHITSNLEDFWKHSSGNLNGHATVYREEQRARIRPTFMSHDSRTYGPPYAGLIPVLQGLEEQVASIP